MTQRAAVKISGIASILTGLTVLFLYFREKLPLTDVYVAKKEFIYYLIYGIAAAAGAFFLAAALKRKEPGFWIVAGLLLVGIPLFFYAVSRAPFDYAPIRMKMIGRGLISAAFLFLGIFALKGFKWVHGVLLAAFSTLCLYHIFLAVKLIAGEGNAFGSSKTGDIIIAFVIAAVSAFVALMNFNALRRPA